jgi:hypothetical protein
VLVAVTSALAVALGLAVLRLSLRDLGRAAGLALEIAGFAAAFVLANMAAGMAFALVMRGSGTFVSLYATADFVLLLFSALQGVVFSLWLRTRRTG